MLIINGVEFLIKMEGGAKEKKWHIPDLPFCDHAYHSKPPNLNEKKLNLTKTNVKIRITIFSTSKYNRPGWIKRVLLEITRNLP